MGTSHSAISRIESGQHSTSVQTLQRLAAALEMRFVMGFEHGTGREAGTRTRTRLASGSRVVALVRPLPAALGMPKGWARRLHH